LGNKRGFYREEGIELAIVETAGGGDTIRAIALGNMAWGTPSPPGVVSAAMKGEPLKIIAGDISAPIISWLVRKDSPIKSIRDLRGRKLGYTRPASNTEFLARKCLKEAGVPLEEVQLISVGGVAAGLTALRTGVVDVAAGDYYTLSRFPNELRLLWDSSEFVPVYYTTMVVTSDRMIRDHPDVLRGLIRAHERSIDYCAANREEAARAWAEATNSDAEIAVRAFKLYSKNAWDIKLDAKGLKSVEEDLIAFKLVPGPVPWSKIIDQSFLPKEKRITLPA
jgi:NitT/TauT family transport system substrate-binding protein